MPIFNRKPAEPEQKRPRQHVPGTYAGRLQHIGRVLDSSGARSASIVEVSGNFIVRAIEKKSGNLLLSEMVQEDFDREHGNGPGRAPATSYEALLPLIGEDLDERVAANIAIIETDDAFEMVGWVHGTAAGRSTYVLIDRAYPRDLLEFKAGQRR